MASQASDYDGAIAAALVYDPPVNLDSPPIEFSREGREPAAFAGFDDVITTRYFLYQDDRQGGYGNNGFGGGYGRGFNNGLDRFERQAITVRTGVSYR